MKLTFEEAKELSVKKWEYIVNNDGKKKGLKKVFPELKYMEEECAMCQYHLIQLEKSCPAGCIYYNTCRGHYSLWATDKTKENAEIILNKLIEANK